jgi:aminoglycoside 2'-N-acetyltransferase I
MGSSLSEYERVSAVLTGRQGGHIIACAVASRRATPDDAGILPRFCRQIKKPGTLLMLDLMTIPSHDMTPAQTDAVIALCSAVFGMDYSYYMNLCPDRVHVLGYVGGSLVSHALWLDRRLRIGGGSWRVAAYVEGVATRADCRARGYGSAVMRRLAHEIAGYDLGALSPAEPAWYERLGWVRWQGPLWIERDGLLEATPGETVLICRTARTGPLDLTATLTGEWRPFELW